MRRILVLLTLVTLGAFGTRLGGVGGHVGLGLVGCGGNDKPPLTPDQIEGEEAGAPAPPAK